MHGLSLCLWIILKNPSFATRNYVLEEIKNIFNVFKSVNTAIHSIFFCSGVRIFGITLAKTVFMPRSPCKKCLNTFLIGVGKFRNCSNAQSAVSSNNSSDLLHILLSFRSGRTARIWIVPDLFPILHKLLKPLENFRARYTLITIYFCQHIVSFCGRFSKFYEEFDVNTLFYISTQHYSDGAQTHDPLVTMVTARLTDARE